jgi:hypothetical protein
MKTTVTVLVAAASLALSSAANADECAHDARETGAALEMGCDTCSAQVCHHDSYCCDVAWDEICVSEANQMCVFLSAVLGTTLPQGDVDCPNGGVLLEIDGAQSFVCQPAPGPDVIVSPTINPGNGLDMLPAAYGSEVTVGVLQLPAGAWRVEVDGEIDGEEWTTIRCGFVSPGQVGGGWSSNIFGYRETHKSLRSMWNVELSSGGTVFFKCQRSSNGTAYARIITQPLVATRLGSLTVQTN